MWLSSKWLEDSRSNQYDEEQMEALFATIAQNRISTVFPELHLKLTSQETLSCDESRIELFLDIAEKHNIKVIPKVGGILGQSAFPDADEWRKNFVNAVELLIEKHPRLSGIQLCIKPWRSDNVSFLKLLDELKQVVKDKTLSVAAFPPPPTPRHNSSGVHWRTAYVAYLTNHCDQLAVMMYDTDVFPEKFYTKLVAVWTTKLASAVHLRKCELLTGIPACLHYKYGENITAALKGIASSGRKAEISGVAAYCTGEMNEEEWRVWRKFIR